MPTETKVESAEFRSPDPALTLVRRPERRRYNEKGELEILEGQRFHFQPGDGNLGVLNVTDPDAIEWLRNHDLCNQKFWEVGNEPGREKPTVTEAMTEVAKAAARGDATAIAAIYQREIESYNREPVKEAASQALAELENPGDAVEEGAGEQEPSLEE